MHCVRHSHIIQYVISNFQLFLSFASRFHVKISAWPHHQMETFSALLVLYTGNSPVTSEFPSQRPVTRSFDVIFDLLLNKRFSKQSWGWWFEMPSCSLWHHCIMDFCHSPFSFYHYLCFNPVWVVKFVFWLSTTRVSSCVYGCHWQLSYLQIMCNVWKALWDEITYPFPNFYGWTVEVGEWISNFIPHSIMDVNIYPCLDLSYSISVTRVPG